MEAKLAASVLLQGTPAGTRAIAEVLSARLEGQRLSGSLNGAAAADWMILSQDNKIGLIDLRCTIRTDDGALIYVQYNGRVLITSAQGRNRACIAPRFETGDSRYLWLNAIQAVGKGDVDLAARRVTYQLYEVV